jgi:hypothetical protein
MRITMWITAMVFVHKFVGNPHDLEAFLFVTSFFVCVIQDLKEILTHWHK